MRLTAKAVVLAVLLAMFAFIATENVAHAQCPPGFRWSRHYWGCVPAGPPPGYYPPPPPPPPPSARRCNWYYKNCVMECGGFHDCVRRCNHRFNRCVNGGGW